MLDKYLFKYNFKLMIVLILFFSSCASSKISENNILFNTRWELESMDKSAQDIKSLFSQKIPVIRFNYSEKVVSGNNGCNGYSATYTINGQTIQFGEPGPTTKMYCGEGEQIFLNAMQKVDGYRIGNKGRLVLMTGNETLLTFKIS